MLELLRIKPLDRGILKRRDRQGLLGVSAFQSVENYISSSASEATPEIAVIVAQREVGADDVGIVCRESQPVNQRRSYYLQSLSGSMEKRLLSTIAILGRHSYTECSSNEDINRDEKVKRIRSLKRLLQAEVNDYPTSFLLSIPHADDVQPTAAKALETFGKYITPILVYPSRSLAAIVESRKAPKETSLISKPQKTKLKDIIPLESSKDLPPYLLVHLVCEMCFHSADNDIWPQKVSLTALDRSFLNKVSAIANSTFRAAHTYFSEGARQGREIYEGGYLECMLQFMGFRGYDEIHPSRDSGALLEELDALLSSSVTLKDLFRYNGENELEHGLSVQQEASKLRQRIKDESEMVNRLQLLSDSLMPRQLLSDLKKYHPNPEELHPSGSITIDGVVFDRASSSESPDARPPSPPSRTKLDTYMFLDNALRCEFDSTATAQLPAKDVIVKPLSGKGFCAREFKKFVFSHDPGKSWGGLKRVVLPSGHAVYLCTSCFLHTISHAETMKPVVETEEESDEEELKDDGNPVDVSGFAQQIEHILLSSSRF